MKPPRNTAVKALLLSCLAFLLLALGASTGVAQQTQNAAAVASTARPVDDSVVLMVTVVDKYGHPASGLIKSDFALYDKTPQEITFFSNIDEPLSVGIILDASASMGGPGSQRFSLLKDALSHFMGQGRSENDYFLIGFNTRPQLLVDWTRDGKLILEKLRSVESKANSAVFDACYLGLDKLAHGSHPKRVLLLLSDGQDNESRYTLNELKRSLKESNVLLYAVGLFNGSEPGSALGLEGQGILDDLAFITGGKAFFPEFLSELEQVLTLIGYELHHQYLLGFRPADNARDGKWHSLKVKVKLPPGAASPELTLYVRSRLGYYTAKSPR